MKLNKLALALVMTIGMASAAQAAVSGTPGGTGTVNFKGQIVDAPCSIKPDSNNQDVDMGAVTVKTLEAGRSSNVPFELHLESCDVSGGAKTVGIMFDGVRAEQGNDALLMLNGSAKGAGLGIVDKTGKDLVLGSESSLGEVVQGDNTLSFTAYLEKLGQGGTAASVVPGSYTSIANFTLTYK